MSLEAWVAFCVTEAVLCFTPGPAVLLVVSVALGRGLRPSLGGGAPRGLRGESAVQSGTTAKKRSQDERLHPATAFSRCHSGVVAPRRRRAGRAGSPGAAHGKA